MTKRPIVPGRILKHFDDLKVGEEIVDLKGKVKFPRCEVVFCGDRIAATAYLAANGAGARAIVGGTATAGHEGTATLRRK
jgi:hypothetical protein